MEGIISSEFIDTTSSSSTGYGMYRWAYRYYEDKNQALSPDTLVNRDGNTGVASASRNCEEDRFTPPYSVSGSGAGFCDNPVF